MTMISTIFFVAQRWFQWKTVSVRMYVPFWVKIKALLFPNMGRESFPFRISFCIFRNLSHASFILLWFLPCIQKSSVLDSRPDPVKSLVKMTNDLFQINLRCQKQQPQGKPPLVPLSYSSGAFEDPVRTSTRSQLSVSSPGTCLCPCEHRLISGRNTTHSKFLTMKRLSGT